MKTSKILITSLTVILLLLVAYSAWNKINSPGNKEYKINKVAKDIKTLGTLTSDNEYNFSTYVQLGANDVQFPALVKLNLKSGIQLDKKSNSYIFKNPKLEVSTIGCKEYAKNQQVITDSEYKANFQFGVQQNEHFSQSMEVGIAKPFLDNKSIAVNSVAPVNNSNQIYSVSDIKKSKDNKANVTVDYNNIKDYFSCWYNISVKCISKKEVVFSVN